MGFFAGKKIDPQVQEMSDWLAHPNEYGVPPKKAWNIGTFPVNIMPNPNPINVSIIGYEMPDGTTGRGFVGYITWAFVGDGVEKISDESLLLAYTGWAFIFPGYQSGKIVTDFEETDQERQFREEMAKVKDFEITGKTRIGELELFDYRGFGLGMKIKGCGSVETNLYYTEDMPEYNLPSIYYVLGHEQNG